jgi:hypothetical protein
VKHHAGIRYGFDKGSGFPAVPPDKAHLSPLKPAQMPQIPDKTGDGIPVQEQPFDQVTSYKPGSSRNKHTLRPFKRHLFSWIDPPHSNSPSKPDSPLPAVENRTRIGVVQSTRHLRRQ